MMMMMEKKCVKLRRLVLEKLKKKKTVTGWLKGELRSCGEGWGVCVFGLVLTFLLILLFYVYIYKKTYYT